jgi:hypothetical protein
MRGSTRDKITSPDEAKLVNQHLALARAAHEVNRAYCLAIGDDSQTSWDDAPDWQKVSALEGVRGVLAGDGPRESHARWLAEKTRTGWKYGYTKCIATKEHPCVVPYDQLPLEQKRKDDLFVGTVRLVAGALGLLEPEADVQSGAADPEKAGLVRSRRRRASAHR